MLFLEPWGEEFQMQSGKVFEFIAKAEQKGSFEIAIVEEDIIIYAWSGSTVKVFCDGEELGAGNFERSTVPNIPKGQSISTFLGLIFGKTK